MSERSVRKSTQDLRSCYSNESRHRSRSRGIQARRRIRTEKTTSPNADAREGRMATNAQQTPAVPNAGQPENNGQTATAPPNPGDGNQVGDPAPVVNPNPESPGHGHEDRITKLEQQLKEYKAQKEEAEKRSARSASRSTTRTTRHGRSSPSRTARSKSTRRDRTRTRSRSHSRSRRSTRSRRRSSSRRTRRTRSRSDSTRRHRRRRDTRSRSHRRSGSRRTRSRSTRTRSTSRRREKTTTPSRNRDTDLRKQVDDALNAQYPSMGKAKGKPLPVKGLPKEPYYNLPPDLRSKARARRSRSDMTFPEYMCGYLNMTAKAVPEGSDARAAIDHAAQVAQDAAGYTWSAVREWSQTCLSHIKDTTKSWVGNDDLFTRERTRLSWIKGKPLREVRIPCHPHNVDKCYESATHSAEGKKWVHGCAVCIYASTDEQSAQAATTHTVRTCRRKPTQKYPQDDNRSDYRWRNNQQQGKKDNRSDNQKPKN